MASHTVTITGASGKTGSVIVRLATRRGWRVRAASRRPPRSGEWVRLDWDDEHTWEPAFAGSDAAYVLLPFNHPGAAERTTHLLTAAVEAGVPRIVLLTSWDASHETPGGPLTAAEHTLQQLPATGVILRPTWFLDNFTTGSFAAMTRRGQIRLPAGNASIPFIDVRDVAATAVAALAADGPSGVLPLTGPESIDHFRVANALSTAAGRRITYVPVTVDDFAAHLATLGFSPDYGRFLGRALEDVANGRINIPVEDTVQSITGRPPFSVENFAHHHAATLRNSPRASNAGREPRSKMGTEVYSAMGSAGSHWPRLSTYESSDWTAKPRTNSPTVHGDVPCH